ncbi:MAG: quinone-dependent dihydroorotate dehydrogenase [Opitutaceae bacterium]
MGSLYEKLFRPILFCLEAERAHELSVNGLRLVGAIPGLVPVFRSRARRQSWGGRIKVFGVTFPNRVGLAAGYDKNAVCWRGLSALGFGHVEVGTLTFRPQPGNPRPRLFRYPAQEAIINRMGFNNEGAERAAARLAKAPPPGRRPMPIGVNIGKSKVASLDEAVEDYLGSFRLLARHADYLVVNVSSPNTPDLRKLQDAERLRMLLGALTRANDAGTAGHGRSRCPLLVKIAPDLTWREIDDVLGIIDELGLDGIIATNTTLARPGPFAGVDQAGGLSGAPLTRAATGIIRYISRSTEGRLPIIGVGGIMDGRTAAEKIDAGATLVQVYSGMIYRGPSMPIELARAVSSK